jgi:hypothetical protein
MAFAAVQMAFWGVVIRTNGPAGFVHGFGDLSRLSAERQSSIGRCVSNCMFAIGAAILAFGVASYLYRANLAVLVTSAIVLIAVIGAVTRKMKRRLSQLTMPTDESHRGH